MATKLPQQLALEAKKREESPRPPLYSVDQVSDGYPLSDAQWYTLDDAHTRALELSKKGKAVTIISRDEQRIVFVYLWGRVFVPAEEN